MVGNRRMANVRAPNQLQRRMVSNLAGWFPSGFRFCLKSMSPLGSFFSWLLHVDMLGGKYSIYRVSGSNVFLCSSLVTEFLFSTLIWVAAWAPLKKEWTFVHIVGGYQLRGTRARRSLVLSLWYHLTSLRKGSSDLTVDEKVLRQ